MVIKNCGVIYTIMVNKKQNKFAKNRFYKIRPSLSVPKLCRTGVSARKQFNIERINKVQKCA